jgi:ABC-type Fe3+/spermidine/putrescine transport system ATPase subunit
MSEGGQRALTRGPVAFDGADKYFGETQVLEDISLSVDEREVVVVIGPSGSGKSTLLRCVNRLEEIQAGEIRLAGESISAPDADVNRLRQRIGMVFQSFNLFPHKTARENVMLAPVKVKGISEERARERAEKLIERVGLSGQGDSYPNQLSGGQQQRVALARGLISRPSVLLLDEPLANLDRELRREMEVEVRRFEQDLVIPFVYVTHNQEEALTLSDRIAVMHEGRVEQVGPKLEIYHRPASRFVAGFVGAPNRLRARIADKDGAHVRLEWDGIDLIGHKRDDGAIGDVVDLFLKPERIRIAAGSSEMGDGTGNRLEGVLRDVIFKGPYMDCLVALRNRRELTVSAPPETAGLVRGGTVWIGWPPEAAAAFPADDS